MNRKKILPLLLEVTGIAAIGSGIGIDLATLGKQEIGVR